MLVHCCFYRFSCNSFFGRLITEAFVNISTLYLFFELVRYLILNQQYTKIVSKRKK
jgi:hypothetical protein